MNDIPDEMKEVDELVHKAALSIAEHVDSVRIFVTKKCENGQEGTWRMTAAEGNWFASYGQIVCWVNEENKRQDL